MLNLRKLFSKKPQTLQITILNLTNSVRKMSLGKTLGTAMLNLKDLCNQKQKTLETVMINFSGFCKKSAMASVTTMLKLTNFFSKGLKTFATIM